MSLKRLLLTLLLLQTFCGYSDDAIPESHVGTWKRQDLIDKKGRHKTAAQQFLMIMRPNGLVTWPKHEGLLPHAPMKITIRKNGQMFEKELHSKKPRPVGEAIVAGNIMTMTFQPIPMMPKCTYVRVSKSFDDPQEKKNR